MATHVQGIGANGSASPLTPTLGVGVTAGNLITVCVAWEEFYRSTPTVSDGTTGLTAGTHYSWFDGTYYGNAQCFYFLSAPNAGKTVFTVTFDQSFYGASAFVTEWNDAGAWTLDVGNAAGNDTNDFMDSGAITTTGTDEVVIGYNHTWTGTATFSNPVINSVAATEPAYSPQATYDHYVYRILGATFSGGHYIATLSGAYNQWIQSIISFKAAAGGGTNKVIIKTNYYEKMRIA